MTSSRTREPVGVATLPRIRALGSVTVPRLVLMTLTNALPSRGGHLEAQRLDVLPSMLHLIAILRILIHLHDFGGVQAKVARIRIDHIARIPARWHAFDIRRFDALEDIRANADASGHRNQVFAALLASLTQHIAKIHFVHAPVLL